MSTILKPFGWRPELDAVAGGGGKLGCCDKPQLKSSCDHPDNTDAIGDAINDVIGDDIN